MSLYGRRRRRRLLFGALALLLAVPAFAAGRHLLHGSTRMGIHTRGGAGSAVRWPAQGQAAFVLGHDRPAASPNQPPVPIASLAKVMTAYLVLKRHPLSGAQDGFTLTVSAADAQAAARDRAQGQSVVAVAAGERLTERQLLEALLIPSGNDIAQMLAARVAGDEARFVAEMNAAARALGMGETTYTDPSGFDPSTVSTAADQLRVFRRTMRFEVFRQIVSMPAVTLPVAGTMTNFDPLIGQGYAGKTGSDSAAGGCLAFFTRVTVAGHRRTAVGVVLGQGEGSDTSALLAAAGQAAERLVALVAPTVRARTVAVSARGQLAVAACRGAEGVYRPFAIVVLARTQTHLARISLFAAPTPTASVQARRRAGTRPQSGTTPAREPSVARSPPGRRGPRSAGRRVPAVESAPPRNARAARRIGPFEAPNGRTPASMRRAVPTASRLPPDSSFQQEYSM